ncbi:hypothetical protein IW262DRAFT_1294490 [Armillaria fumosa]|nr:hypothetical protein IW262DRAFT_1294490 [Armillaria fumosa]
MYQLSVCLYATPFTFASGIQPRYLLAEVLDESECFSPPKPNGESSTIAMIPGVEDGLNVSRRYQRSAQIQSLGPVNPPSSAVQLEFSQVWIIIYQPEVSVNFVL